MTSTDCAPQQHPGFTLIEMLVVVAIIAILAVVAIPSKGHRHIQLQVVESLELAQPVKDKVASYYTMEGKFPETNATLNLPIAEQYVGNYLSSLSLDNGAIHLRLGQKSPEMLQGKTLSLQPVFVKAAPQVPASWICGYNAVPAGMEAAGENRTDIPVKYLPLRCRQ